MGADRIDFISAYCDRWCGRCAFTERCSSFAVQVAEAMCDGDRGAAIELAVGPAQPVHGDRQPTIGEQMLKELGDFTISDKEMAEYKEVEQARRKRLDGMTVTKMADVYTTRAADWLRDHRERLQAGADPALRDALDVAGWDVWLIGAKLHRALHGRDESRRGEIADDHPVQNDWNGSAKVALISIERSVSAWRTITQVTGDHAASAFADGLGHLRRALEREFPDATAFVRPGFDDASERLR